MKEEKTRLWRYTKVLKGVVIGFSAGFFGSALSAVIFIFLMAK